MARESLVAASHDSGGASPPVILQCPNPTVLRNRASI
jgi:hypothetical protein